LAAGAAPGRPGPPPPGAEAAGLVAGLGQGAATIADHLLGRAGLVLEHGARHEGREIGVEAAGVPGLLLVAKEAANLRVAQALRRGRRRQGGEQQGEAQAAGEGGAADHGATIADFQAPWPRTAVAWS
jgi:hypothetical protein